MKQKFVDELMKQNPKSLKYTVRMCYRHYDELEDQREKEESVGRIAEVASQFRKKASELHQSILAKKGIVGIWGDIKSIPDSVLVGVTATPLEGQLKSTKPNDVWASIKQFITGNPKPTAKQLKG